MDDKLLARCFAAAQAAYEKTADVSPKVFGNPDAFATELLVHTRRALGPEWVRWEPETLWRELPKMHPLNEDKLLAVQALAMFPAFYWEPRVYGNTILALNNEVVHPNVLPTHLSGPALTWGTVEAELIFALTEGDNVDPEFDPEVEAYVAILLFDQGYTNSPVSFADELLREHLSPEGQALHAKVKADWRLHSKDHLEADAYEDSALGVQLERQAACHLYAVKRAQDLITRL